MEVINYFGPPLVKLRAEDSLVNEINRVADKILAKIQDVFVAHKIHKGFLASAENYIRTISSKYVEAYGLDPLDSYEIEIADTFIVSQTEGVWNRLHHHTGQLSGIIYLKIPEKLFNGPIPEGIYPGGIAFIEGSPGPFHHTTMTVTPVLGDVYIFPSTLHHTVYPFFGPEERRAFVFNMNVTKKSRGLEVL